MSDSSRLNGALQTCTPCECHYIHRENMVKIFQQVLLCLQEELNIFTSGLFTVGIYRNMVRLLPVADTML